MPRTATSPSPNTASLALSSLHTRYQALDKEHQWLLKQIKRKQTELKNFVEQMHSVVREMYQRGNPSFNKVVALDLEIHALFTEILATRKLGKQTRKKVVGIYHNLQTLGIISARFVTEESDYEPKEVFETDEPKHNFSRSPQEDHEHYQQTKQEHEHHQQTNSEFFSTSRTDDSRKIRQTFIKLAEIFHPDKVADSQMQTSYTEIMKEINKAYQDKDLARLLEIERLYQGKRAIESNNQDDLTQHCNRLEEENELLLAQYETLKQELRLIKNSSEGVMVSDYRKLRRQGIDPIAKVLEKVDSELQTLGEIHDFVKNFQQQEITIKEFLRGPAVLRQLSRELMEDLFEQMIGDLGVTVVF